MSDWDVTLREPEAGSNIAAHEVVELLSSLVDKNLVLIEGDRYRLLETVRQYGRGRLNDAGESDSIRERHLSCFLALAEEAEPHLTGPDQQSWLETLELEYDNLRAALEWSADSKGGADLRLRLAGTLWRFWYIQGFYGEGRHRLSAVLGQPGRPGGQSYDGDIRSAQAKALNGAGALAFRQGDYPASRALIEESLAISRDLGDRYGIARSLNSLGNVASDVGDYSASRVMHEESLAIKRELGDRPGVAMSLGNLGNVAYDEGDYPAAQALYDECLAKWRELGDRHGIAASLCNLSLVSLDRGDYSAARVLQNESLAISRNLGDRHGIAMSLITLGAVAAGQGDYIESRILHEESLVIKREVGDLLGIAESLGELGQLARAEGRLDHCVRLWGAAESLRGAIGSPRHAAKRSNHESELIIARESLGTAAFDSAFSEGRAMTLEQAIALALENHDSEAD